VYGRLISHDLVKRDAVRIFCDRMREWLGRHIYSTGENDGDLQYRKGWNAAMKSVQQYLSR